MMRYSWLLGLLLLISATDSFAEIQRLFHVEEFYSQSDTPPAVDADWQPRELPRLSRVGIGTGDARVWFRFTLKGPEDRQQHRYALYFWRVNQSMSLFMNGRLIGGDVIKKGYDTAAWNHPLLIDIQSGNWQDGDNVFHIRFNPTPYGGTFADFKFGKFEELRPVWQSTYDRSIRVNEILLAFGLFTAATTLLLWLYRRNDKVYLWFFATTVCWCVVITHMVVYHNIIPYKMWLPIVHIAIDGWAFAMFAFVNRFMKLNYRRLEWLLLGVMLIAFISHVQAPRAYWWFAAYSFHLVMIFGLIIAFVRVSFKAIAERDKMAFAVIAAVLGQILLSLRDTFLFLRGDAEDWENAVHMSQFGIPILLLVFIFSLLNRFVSALAESETLNLELEDRVDATRTALQKSFEENRQLELDRAAAEERQKIYRDLHDDVGSKLLTIVHQTPQESVTDLASSALDSLREAVYRANYRDEPLLDFLAGVREEAKLRSVGQGFSCDWFEDPDLPNDALVSKQCYHLSRIFRELVSNSLAHSGGDKISVAVEFQEDKPGWLGLEFTDNGPHPSLPEISRSSGLRNIEHRAAELGGSVTWSTKNNGLSCYLSFEPEYQLIKAG